MKQRGRWVSSGTRVMLEGFRASTGLESVTVIREALGRPVPDRGQLWTRSDTLRRPKWCCGDASLCVTTAYRSQEGTVSSPRAAQVKSCLQSQPCPGVQGLTGCVPFHETHAAPRALPQEGLWPAQSAATISSCQVVWPLVGSTGGSMNSCCPSPARWESLSLLSQPSAGGRCLSR